jgi:K+-transporting ATPase ATPase A chain
MWTLAILLLAVTILMSILLRRYFVLLMDGRNKAPRWLGWFEARLDTGEQEWTRYIVAMLDRQRVAGDSGAAQTLRRPILMAA